MIPAARHPAPALPLALAVIGLNAAVAVLLLNGLRVDPELTRSDDGRWWFLIRLSSQALELGAFTAAAALAVGLVRRQRSPGGALATAALLLAVVILALQLVASWKWPVYAAARGWRFEVLQLGGWIRSGVMLAVPAGLGLAAWDDRAVRVIAPAALGSAVLAAPPPPLLRWLYATVERDAVTVTADGGTLTVDDTRLWAMAVGLAVCGAAWGAAAAWLASRQRRLPPDAMVPRPPAPALRRFAIAGLIEVVIAIAGGLAIAVAQGKAQADTGVLPLLIPSAIAVATALVAVALLGVATADVDAAASRRFAAAAILILWLVVVVVAQTLWSRHPTLPNSRFTVFEAPWMPGMVGAAVAVAALIAITAGMRRVAAQAGLRASRAHGAIVVLALIMGAATAPWVLGFGTRTMPLDGLRVATLGSAAIVNLAAWIALGRSAWRLAAALEA